MEIVKALNGNNEQMFEKVFRHYYGMLCRYAGTILSDRDEAEEIVQQTRIKVW